MSEDVAFALIMVLSVIVWGGVLNAIFRHWKKQSQHYQEEWRYYRDERKRLKVEDEKPSPDPSS